MKKILLPTALLSLVATASHADMKIEDAYALAASPNAKAGAAFMEITNHSETADRLVAAISDVAARVELHTHIEKDGVMRMTELEDGIPFEADETVLLKRGGIHVMFMGLNRSLNDGDLVEVTLSFENAGNVTIEVPVDLNRKPAPDAHGADHSGHKH
jgi:copper(I)-binding protein